MPLKQHAEKIDGITYTTTTLPATDGLRIMPKLVDLLGETGMALLLATSDEEKESLMENAEITAALMSSIAERAAENDGLLVIKDLLASTKCDKIQIGDNFIEGSVAENFDDHFAGRYMHLIRVAIWVGRASFGEP